MVRALNSGFVFSFHIWNLSALEVWLCGVHNCMWVRESKLDDLLSYGSSSSSGSPFFLTANHIFV